MEVENYRIKIGQGSNLWRDYFLSSLFKGIYDNACLILKLKKKQTQNNQSLSKKKSAFLKVGFFLIKNKNDAFDCFYRSFSKFNYCEPDPAYAEAKSNFIRQLQSMKRCYDKMFHPLSQNPHISIQHFKDEHEHKISNST